MVSVSQHVTTTAAFLVVFLTHCVGYLDGHIMNVTRRVDLKQGRLYGIVVEPKMNKELPRVEQYLGIPYAEPPVGKMRFMPPGNAPFWDGDKYATSAGPVCPQKFPDTRNMEYHRKEYFQKLVQYLTNQSEDCLYLNVYAPFQGSYVSQYYPVIVFLHGESYEWNSGNPYDGSVLAAYGNVVVVTINFRLGILGFLQAGTGESSNGNFGLVDQIAALLWVQENIEKFGGDHNKVTLVGHGTGAACANLLMLSPMVQHHAVDNNNKLDKDDDIKLLFQRVILMGGSALSDWAMAGNPRQVTYQVSQALNCPLDDEFLDCLRRKRLSDIINVSVETPPYTTTFGPIVDGLVIPNDPKMSMTTYNDLFSRFEAMFGTTQSEAMHLLDAVYLTHGMLKTELEKDLKKYMRVKCEMRSEVCMTHTMAEYQRNVEVGSGLYDGPDMGQLNRDALLDILSDARTVAPLMQTAIYHSSLNSASFFYVFGQATASQMHVADKTFHGEEIPYVFGVPLDGPKAHYTDQFTEHEKLMSKTIMSFWSKFAHDGDPNSDTYNAPMSFRERVYVTEFWPKFSEDSQQYLYLRYPPSLAAFYRKDKMWYWNQQFPNLIKNPRNILYDLKPSRSDSQPSINSDQFPFPFFRRPRPTPLGNKEEVFGTLTYDAKNQHEQNLEFDRIESVITQDTNTHRGSTMNIFIIIGGIFLFVNMFLFIGLYYKCSRMRKRGQIEKPRTDDHSEVTEDASEKCGKLPKTTFMMDGCNFFKSMTKNSREDVYEAVRINGSASGSKLKLTRQMSSSTIDPKIKVRDWIAHEIVQKYSPHFLRRENVDKSLSDAKFFKQKRSLKPPLQRSDSKTVQESPSLGRSPTRPVSPVIEKPPLKKKPEKVSVAVDATPAGRGSSVLRQQPIELTKSLDCPPCSKEVEVPLRRSLTLDNVSSSPKVAEPDSLYKSSTNINMNLPSIAEPVVLKIHHGHSKSDPVEDFYTYTKPKNLKSFEPGGDVNVTSRDEQEPCSPLSPEESLRIIRRRNFPKVLPDFPAREALQRKRMSMPACHNQIPEKIYARFPPAPPVRTTSTLGRNAAIPPVMCHSAPVLAEEPPSPEEPEVTCNNLYVGPLLPKPDTHGVCDKLPVPEKARAPKLVVTTDPENPVKRVKPKVIIRPNASNRDGVKNRNVPRVVASDNVPSKEIPAICEEVEPVVKVKQLRPSQIPTFVKNASKDSSSSDSTPSEESDTGTVVKRV